MTDPKPALALHGGSPVREALLPYGRHSIEEDDVAAVVEALRSGWLTTGPAVADFEAAVAETVAARFGVAFSSGTAALHAACFAAGLGPGDEAITTPLTFCATANCVLHQGARPVFADVCPDTLNLDPAEVERRISPRTRALLPVDYAGHPADLDAILAIARERRLAVIEDASHALGARLGERPVGSLAQLTVFSFHPVKHVATGEGGLVATDDPELAARLRRFRNHGIDADANQRERAGEWFYAMTDLGMNYRIPDLACALGRSQLRRLPANLARRRAIAARYGAALGDVAGLRLPTVRDGVEPAWHLYPVRLELERLSAARREIFRALRAEGIGVNVHYVPVHLHPYYRKHLGSTPGSHPVAEDAYERLLSLPMFHGMTDRDVDDVIAAVCKVIGHYRKA